MEVKLDKRYPVAASPAQAWAVLRDVHAVAGCMPGASITEQLDATARANSTLSLSRQTLNSPLTVSTLDQDRIILDVEFDGPRPATLPFAALRSMYTTETNADVARVEWRTKDSKGWSEAPIMTFPGGKHLRSPLLALGMLWYRAREAVGLT